MLDGFELPPELSEEVFQPLGVWATFEIDEFEHRHRLTRLREDRLESEIFAVTGHRSVLLLHHKVPFFF